MASRPVFVDAIFALLRVKALTGLNYCPDATIYIFKTDHKKKESFNVRSDS